MSRREFLQRSSRYVAAGAALASGRELLASEKKSHKRPNLLFVFADQMRSQAMGCSGNEQVMTPNLDRLAGQGLRLSNATSTFPVCSPYRAMLMTGRYPLSNTVITNGPALPERELCIAEVLKSAGYQTGYIGKWDLNGRLNPQFVPPGPKRQGFDYWAASNFIHNYFNSYYYRDTDEKIMIEGWEPDTQTDLAIKYMEQQKGNRPFCLFLSYGPPHDPYIAPERFRKMYNADKLNFRENVFHNLGNKEVLLNYYAAITALDWNMGRLMKAMDRLGIADDTIVIFTSDHGDMLYSLYLFQKQWPYEESISVPFIIRWPKKIKPAQVSDLLMGSPDIMPTLLGLMGVGIPNSVEGKDLSGFLLGTAVEPEPESVLIEVVTPCARSNDRAGMRAWRGIKTKRYTYVCFHDEDWVLIDNKYDPYQRRNLIYNSEYKPLRDKLNAKLQQWLKKTNDPFLPGSAYYNIRTEMIHDRPPLYKPDRQS